MHIIKIVFWTFRGLNYPYIVASRKRHRQFNEDEAVIVKEDKKCTVKAQKVIDSENDEILVSSLNFMVQ